MEKHRAKKKLSGAYQNINAMMSATNCFKKLDKEAEKKERTKFQKILYYADGHYNTKKALTHPFTLIFDV